MADVPAAPIEAVADEVRPSTKPTPRAAYAYLAVGLQRWPAIS
jgi:hypothetical protein